MTHVVPAVLVDSEQTFRDRITHEELLALAPIWQIDILDGSMFNATSWAEPDIMATYDLPKLELHLMTEHPLEHLRKFMHYTPHTVARAIIHAEIRDNIEELLNAIHTQNIGTGLAINPETTLDNIRHLVPHIDLLLVMGVHPGKSGQPFLGDPILEKIRDAREQFPNLPIAVDGGVTEENAEYLAKAGATQLCTSSSLWKSTNIIETFNKMSKS